MPIDRRALVSAVYTAVDEFIERYNEATQDEPHGGLVRTELEGDEITIDGGHIHGVFFISVRALRAPRA